MKKVTLAAAHKAITPIVRTVTNNPRANPRQLKPGELLQLLNSTPLGEVLSDAKLRRHRQRAALRIGDGKTIDIIRYAGWLVSEIKRGPAIVNTTLSFADAYDRKKSTEAARNRLKASLHKDIGAIPKVVNPERRAACARDFKLFSNTYGRHVFSLAWGKPHLAAAERIEKVVLNGGLFALAMPRGWGKTTLCQWAVMWAILYGHRRFSVYVGATDEAATARLDEIKIELETNELLFEDFPEVCKPVRALEGITQRGRGQTVEGQRTRITWLDNRIVLPTIPGSVSSGSVIAARGITSRGLRGMKVTTAESKVLRPDIAIPDDPQDDQSAVSPDQCRKRLRIINSTILRLPGPKVRIAAFVPCTVIAANDLADQLLNPELNPRWNGQRTVALERLPTSEALWEQYAAVRAEGLRQKDGGKAGRKFFEANRTELERGAQHNWPENIEDGDVSAIQSAMNVKIDDPETFAAELQQAPLAMQEEAQEKVDRSELAARIVSPPMLIVAQHASRLTAFVDPNSKLMWYLVCGFGNHFSGHAIKYGTWPDQRLMYVTSRDAKKTIARAKPRAGLQAQIYHALEQLTEELLSTEFRDESGQIHKIEKLLIDANWGAITKTVYRFARSSKYAGIITPSHGKFLGARDKPIEQWPTKDGDRIGFHWRERYAPENAKRFVLFDTNRWKSLVTDRLRVAIGDPGALTVFDARPEMHRLLFDHWTSETPVEEVKLGERLTIWKEQKGRDNDLWDGIVGCHVAASMLGIDLAPTAGGRPEKPKPSPKPNRVTPLRI